MSGFGIDFLRNTSADGVILFDLKSIMGREISQWTGSESRRCHSEGKKQQPVQEPLSRILEQRNTVVTLTSLHNGLLYRGKSNQWAGIFRRIVLTYLLCTRPWTIGLKSKQVSHNFQGWKWMKTFSWRTLVGWKHKLLCSQMFRASFRKQNFNNNQKLFAKVW